MEMGNVSKRQQPNQREDNNQRPPMGLQCSEKFPHPEACLNEKICVINTSAVLPSISNVTRQPFPSSQRVVPAYAFKHSCIESLTVNCILLQYGQILNFLRMLASESEEGRKSEVLAPYRSFTYSKSLSAKQMCCPQ